MKKVVVGCLLILIGLSMVPMAKGQPVSVGKDDIVILYENDVHGSIEGYPLMAALRDRMRELTPYVAVVSAGDFLSGTPVGSVSKGRYLVRMMNAVGYDFVTLGNHEFDFGVDTLKRRMDELTATVLCDNFTRVGDSLPCYGRYALRSYGGVVVAFLGVATPYSLTTSTPLFFQDAAGRWLYTFCPHSIDSLVQRSVDEVRRQGADYVVLLSHLGDNDLPSLVAATRGIDVVLDGHSHSVIPHQTLRNRDGGAVLWTSTGANFENIGRLVIPSKGKPVSELLPTASMAAVNNAVADTLRAIRQAYDAISARRVGYSQARLWRKGHEGNRYDTPMGNFFCDAFRQLTGADVALMNSGGMRNDIQKGDLHYGDLYAAAPFDNQLCLVEMSGQALLDALEMSCHRFPLGFGGFLQVAGLTFEIDTSRRSPVVCDENGVFVTLSGERRVKNVRVWDTITHEYRPIVASRLYRVAGCDYTLLRQGDGHRFPDCKVVNAAICPYVDAIERYLRLYLGGIIDETYAHPQGRIIVK